MREPTRPPPGTVKPPPPPAPPPLRTAVQSAVEAAIEMERALVRVHAVAPRGTRAEAWILERADAISAAAPLMTAVQALDNAVRLYLSLPPEQWDALRTPSAGT